MDIPSMRREIRYGMPVADQIIFNRHYILGYSYYFRQAKWALEIINASDKIVERAENFRSDLRIPEIFRADLIDYKGSGYDRGHLVASANQREMELQNSETFLLSNMSPQRPKFNRGIWKKLEKEVRNLDAETGILETYVICGPIFAFEETTKCIGKNDKNGVSLPIPTHYFKSILTENNKGKLDMWSFILPNDDLKEDIPLESFLYTTTETEIYTGIELWSNLKGQSIEKLKNREKKMWGKSHTG